MDTWIVYVTARTLWGAPADATRTREVHEGLTLNAGRTGKPGIDPEAVLLADGALRIRQAFPMVDAFQAASLARDSLRRILRPTDIHSIETVQHGDWLRNQR